MTRENFKIVRRCGVTWIESGELARLSWLVHGFSTRVPLNGGGDTEQGDTGQLQGSDFNLGFTEGFRRGEILANRERFAQALGRGFTMASLKQIHSAAVYHVLRHQDATPSRGADGARLEYRAAGSEDRDVENEGVEVAAAARKRRDLASSDEAAAGDVLMTSEPGILLTIRTADCLPVLIVDRRLRAIAAIHAGWRGMLARIVEKSVGEMLRLFNSRPADLVAALGPGIGPCCYEVGDEVVDAFRSQFVQADGFFRQPSADSRRSPSELRYDMLFHTQASAGHRRDRARLHLDLVGAARAQLLAAGVKPVAVDDSGYCTACRADLFFSHRRDGARAGRMMAALGLRP